MKRHPFCCLMVCLLGCVLAWTPINAFGLTSALGPIPVPGEGDVVFGDDNVSMPIYNIADTPSSGGYIVNIMAGGAIVPPSVPLSIPVAPSGLNAVPGSPLTFNFTEGPGLVALQVSNPALHANVISGFQSAGDWWSVRFADPVTVNVTIDFGGLPSGVLGSTSNNTEQANFSPVKTALDTDMTTADDATAVAFLQPGTALDMVTIDTSGTPYPLIRDNDGSGNNFALDVPRANLKALGMRAANDPAEDGAITFSDAFSWDFDASNGVGGSSFDFVGVAAHEIGHLMGFVSGVDIVDLVGGSGPYAPTDLDNFRVFSVLDLYRYSAYSLSLTSPPQPAPGAVLDLAYGDTPFFSLDAGLNNLATFSTGSYNGDGRQASHWKDNLGLGLLDPTAAPGETLAISALDVQAMDVIGWDAHLVPEPSSIALLLVGSLGLAGFIWRRRRAA